MLLYFSFHNKDSQTKKGDLPPLLKKKKTISYQQVVHENENSQIQGQTWRKILLKKTKEETQNCCEVHLEVVIIMPKYNYKTLHQQAFFIHMNI